MVTAILNFGDGLLWFNYLLFCAVASLGVLQLTAAHARLVGMMLLPPALSRWLGAALIAGAYLWFFSVQPDLFIPGLAGGELFILFLLGFFFGLLAALGLGVVASALARARALSARAALGSIRSESIVLADGFEAELLMAAGPAARSPSPELPLVLALREAPGDSLDVLAARLAASGAQVLLCREQVRECALEFLEANAARFPQDGWRAVGVGRGADAVLQLASGDTRFLRVLALAPFFEPENARPGLRWLAETDYWTALHLTFGVSEIFPAPLAKNALVVQGDEDLLVSLPASRSLYAGTVTVGGARHFNLAANAATFRLAADWFQMRAISAPDGASLPALRAARSPGSAQPPSGSRARGEAQE